MTLTDSILEESWFWPLAILAGLSVAGVIAWPLILRHLLENSTTWTKLRRAVGLAIRSLWLQKLRAFLSVLGIIIGTGAVIALMAFGEGSMQDALEDIKRQGATNVIIRSAKPPDDSATASRSFVTSYGLTQRDLERLSTFGDAVTRIVPMRVFPIEARYLDRICPNSRAVATTANYAEVNKLEVARGRFLVERDNEFQENVCVLGSEVADKLFPFEDPLGQSVMVKSHFYRVVGVLKDRMPTGGAGGSLAAEDFNRDVYIPLQTSRGRIGEIVYTRTAGSRSAEKVYLSQITLTVSDIAKVRAVGDMVRSILEQEHNYRKDWLVTVPLDKLEEAERAQERFTRLMVMIASISLIVGGIGIMNIMLATVTERTREIGIRRALGAKQKDITLQFLVEAVVQTSLGGILGVITGLAFVFIVPALARWVANENLPAQVHVPSIFIALGFSLLVGVVFGLYPAWRASRLDPIEALRHD